MKSPSAAVYGLLCPRFDPRPCACVVWSSPNTRKHSFILWLTVLRRLRTVDRVDFLEVDKACVLCKALLETHDHLFFACTFPSEIWTMVRNWLSLSRGMSILRISLKWLKKEKGCTTWLSKLRHAFASTSTSFGARTIKPGSKVKPLNYIPLFIGFSLMYLVLFLLLSLILRNTLSLMA